MKDKEYILIKTYCKDLNIANNIVTMLLNKRLIAGSRIAKVLSRYYEKGTVRMDEKYELKLETRKDKFEIIARQIENFDKDNVYKITYTTIDGYNYDYSNYIDDAIR